MVGPRNLAPGTVTQAQTDQLAKVTQMLTEHFGSFVLVVASQDDAETQEIYDTRMLGGTAKGLGLLNIGQTNLYKSMQNLPPRS